LLSNERQWQPGGVSEPLPRWRGATNSATTINRANPRAAISMPAGANSCAAQQRRKSTATCPLLGPVIC
jgi:hypothetical protein